jgi:hypothetical protein
MRYKIVVSDRAFNVIREIQDICEDISWSYNRIGGCGPFSFNVPIRFCQETFFGGNFNIKIYIKNESTNEYDLWYQGRIDNKIHNVRGKTETIAIRGNGYQGQLKDIIVNRSYTSNEVSVIVKSLLDNDITANTDISYSAGDLTATGFTPDSIDFNYKDGLDCFETLANLVGGREWGVDEDRKFYFKTRSSTVGLRFPLNKDVLSWSNDSTASEIINRIQIVGGDVSGSPYTATFNDTASQAKWGRRDKVIQNSAIITSQVATQFADATFDEFASIVRRGRLELLTKDRIEATIPIPLGRVIGPSVTWGSRRWGTFLYSGRIDYQVNRISYRIDSASNLKASIQLGQLRPSIAEDLGKLEFKIDQVRQSI